MSEKQKRYRERRKTAAIADEPIDLREFIVYSVGDENGARVHSFCPAGTEPLWRDLPADSPAMKWIAAHPGERLGTHMVRGERRARNKVSRTPRPNPEWILANESPGCPAPAPIPYPDDDRQYIVYWLRERSPTRQQAPFVYWFAPADVDPPWSGIDPNSPAGRWIASVDWVVNVPTTPIIGLERARDRVLSEPEGMHNGPTLSVYPD